MRWLLERIVPNDTRGWLSLGLFSLMVYILSLVAFVSGLDDSQLFTALASGIIGSGFGSVVGYHFATTKSSSDKSESLNAAMRVIESAPVMVSPNAQVDMQVTKDEE